MQPIGDAHRPKDMRALIPVLAALAVLTGCAAPLPSATSSPSPRPAVTPVSSPTPTPQPTPAIACVREVIPSASGDPCPSAIAAVEMTVATLGLPMSRMSLVGGPFICGGYWFGPGSAPACLMEPYLPGQWMHGWVAFVGSSKVAAVLLGHPEPDVPCCGSPPPSPWSWQATVSAFQVPPSSFVFPTGLLP